MKSLLRILLVFSILITPSPVLAAADTVEKTDCKLAIGYDSMDDLKADLLLSAKRLAVNELFGELITAATAVEDFVVTSDQIRASSLGLVRESSIRYYNGDNLGEVCIDVSVYTTAEDRKQFVPVKLTKRNCVSNPDMTTRELRKFAEEEAIIKALVEYDRKLESQDRSKLLNLMQRVTYLESGLLPDTDSYCVRVEGYMTPIEVKALVEFPSQEVLHRPNEPLHIFTDSSWLTYQFESAGWTTLEFDDSPWQSSEIVTYGTWDSDLKGMDAFADWIWNSKAKTNSPVFFRKTMTLKSKPASAQIQISGDNGYELYINGSLIGHDSDWYVAETYDITRYLRIGKNIIAVQVVDAAPPGGLIAHLFVQPGITSGPNQLKNFAEVCQNVGCIYQWTGGSNSKAQIIDINITGDQVTIKYDWNSGILIGVLEGNMLRGTWGQSGVAYQGEFNLVFSEDFQSAEGKWISKDNDKSGHHWISAKK